MEQVDRLVYVLETKGLSGATINRKLAALSKMLQFAEDREYIVKRPRIDRKREYAGRIRWITDEEERTLLYLCHQWGWEEFGAFIILAIDTGCRVGELLRLEFRDVHDGLIQVWMSKNGKHRSVALTKRAQAAIERRKAQTGWQGRVFPNCNNYSVNHRWDRLRGHMGLDKDEQFVPHVMRHTCASRLVQRGITIPVIQQWLGHETITVTMRYAKIAPSNLIVDRLDRCG